MQTGFVYFLSLLYRPSIPYPSCTGHRFKPGYLLRQDLEAQSDDKGGQRPLTAQPIRSPLPVTSTSPTSKEPRPLIAQPIRSPVPCSILKKRNRTTTSHQACRFQCQSGNPPERLPGQRQSKPVHQAMPPTDTRTPSAASKSTSAKISAPPVTPRNSSEMAVWKYPALETDVFKRIQQKRVTFATPKQSRTFHLLQEGLEAPSMRMRGSQLVTPDSSLEC
ncbi:PDZ and LIM domain protein 2-like [Alosa sapidissima]|uniref:PDZ and LIM domain protein 2-like n=1 Tax=Alosa sapidissima TaxID=34773 RepID=UPI001C0828D8|nr:PDZ and LIM domain protein 2-like [Alosa sapidissima]